MTVSSALQVGAYCCPEVTTNGVSKIISVERFDTAETNMVPRAVNAADPNGVTAAITLMPVAPVTLTSTPTAGTRPDKGATNT